MGGKQAARFGGCLSRDKATRRPKRASGRTASRAQFGPSCMRGQATQEASRAISAQLVVLAAGKGTRMMELTENTPKTLLPIVEGRCILEINVQSVVRSKAATSICVVGGHAWDSLRTHLQCYTGCQIAVEGMLNSDYDVAGPCRSIQLALAKAKDSCDRIIIANGDTIFSSVAFQRMKVQDPGLYLLGSRTSSVETDDLVVTCDLHGRVHSASKVNADSAFAIISSGMLAAVGVEAINMLSDALVAVLKREKDTGRQLPWHDVLGHLSAKATSARLLLINRDAWYEFDSRSCLARFDSRPDSVFRRLSACDISPMH